MKKIGILTTFFETDSGYSLIGVVETQIRMLLEHGYEPTVFVQENFQSDNPLWQNSQIDIRPVVPRLHLESGVHRDFHDRMIKIQRIFEEQLINFDICITHDIILQEYYKEHNIAMRNVAKKFPDINWLHWIHSCPTPNNIRDYPNSCRYTKPPGYIIYPNDTDRSIVCQTYGLTGEEWRVKPCRAGHAIDPLQTWNYQELTKEIAIKSDLLTGDITCVYPIRLDRGKQPEKIIRLMSGIKHAGYDPRILIIDWQSSGKRFQNYIDELIELAEQLNIDLNFTSRLDDRAHLGIPRSVVMELMDLSSVYIHPSQVETYSLVVHEAMLRGKLIVLNHDFFVMRELFGKGAIYMDFGSDRVKRNYHPTEQIFWNEEAKRLISEFKQNRALVAQSIARKKWNPTILWPEFESLLYL